MVLNLFKTLASKSSHEHRAGVQPSSSSSSSSRNGSDNPTMTQRSHLPSAPSGSARFGMASQLSPTTTSGSGSTSAFRSALTTASPGGSLSAPSSPSRHKYGGSSTSAIPLMTGRKHPVAIQRNAPPPNICVEKGRIEFVKSAAESTTSATNAGLMAQPPVSSALHPHHVNSSSKLVMGAKIFRPHPPPSAPTLPTAYRASMAPAGKPPPPPPEESVVKHQSKFKDSPGPTLRERSASPKLLPPTSSSRRDSTPPPPHPPTSSGTSASSKIPSRIPSAGRLTNGSKSTTSNRSRESSPIPPPSSGSGRVLPAGGSGTSLKVVAAASSSTSAVQVSPNLVRWRAKLSSSSASPSSSSPSAGNSGQSSKSSAHAKTAAAVTSPSTSLNPQRPHQAARPKHPDDSPLPSVAATAVVAVAAATGIVTGSGGATALERGEEDDDVGDAVEDSSATAVSNELSSHEPANQMQLLNLHYEVKRLEETVQTLLPLRHQQSALIQSYEERLSEAQTRLATAEAEVAALKERLTASEGREAEARRSAQQLLEAERAGSAAGHEQQRLLFDKCLDEIANHVVQALISQKNLQSECRRLRSQVSDLEQRNVALNLLLTQSLRDSMQQLDLSALPGSNSGSKRSSTDGGMMMVKSASHDPAAAAAGQSNQRDSMCSAVSDSELVRLQAGQLQYDSALTGRNHFLVSKDSNWTLSSTSSSSASSCPSQAVLNVECLQHQMASSAGSGRSDPVERAEKLLAVLKHRLFSAQLGSSNYNSRSASGRPKGHQEAMLSSEVTRRPVQDTSKPMPARPSSLCLKDVPSPAVQQQTSLSLGNRGQKAGNQTPSVRALVQVLEKRVSMTGLVSPPAVETGNKQQQQTGTNGGSMAKIAPQQPDSNSPRPPLPHLVGGLVGRAGLRHNSSSSDSPASKDEGYSTMSSDVQVDSSSSSSSFIASGCSSPATLRRSGSTGSGSAPPSAALAAHATRSLPGKRNGKMAAFHSSNVIVEPTTAAVYHVQLQHHSPHRSVQPEMTALHHQHQFHAELLEELKEETGTDQSGEECLNDPLCRDKGTGPSICPSSGTSSYQKEWAGVQLGTLNEDWSPSSMASDSEHPEGSDESDEDDPRASRKRLRNRRKDGNPPKWTSDSELYKAEDDEEEDGPEEPAGGDFKTLQVSKKGESGGVDGQQHPLRRSRARVQLAADQPDGKVERKRPPPSYSELHEMEDWILSSSSEDLVLAQQQQTANGMVAAAALAVISENSYESDGSDEDDDDDGQLFVPEHSSPECDVRIDQFQADDEGDEEGEEEEEEANAMDTEFTRDYYRLVKFESNRSLASSEKYDPLCPSAGTSSDSSTNAAPPDRQVALQTVLDFIAEQQRYCAIRRQEEESASGCVPALASGSTPELPHPNLLDKEVAASSSLVQLRNLIQDEDSSGRDADTSSDDEDDVHLGFSTTWIPVHHNPEARAAMLDRLLLSSSSSVSEDEDSCRSLEPAGSSLQGQSRREVLHLASSFGRNPELHKDSSTSCPSPSIASPSESHC